MKHVKKPKKNLLRSTISGSLLTHFRAKMFIDWMDFHIVTKAHMRPKRVKAAIADFFKSDTAPFVRARNPRNDTSTREFVVRLQDPPALEKLMELEQFLKRTIHLEQPAIVTHWEVAIDFFPKRDTPASLSLELTTRLKKNIAPRNSLLPVEFERSNPREYDNHGIAPVIDGSRRLSAKHSYAIGHRFDLSKASDPAMICAPMWRIYHKTKDRSQTLPNTEHRPRVEVQMDTTSAFHGVRPTLKQLASFDFESLSDYFSFRATDSWEETTLSSRPDTPEIQKLIISHRAKLIDNAGHLVAPSSLQSRRKHAHGTRADSALRERCRDALRQGTRAFRKQKSRKKSHPRMAASHCFERKTPRRVSASLINYKYNYNLPTNHQLLPINPSITATQPEHLSQASPVQIPHPRD